MNYYKASYITRKKKLFSFYKQYDNKYFSVFSWVLEDNVSIFYFFKNKRIALSKDMKLISKTEFQRKMIQFLLSSDKFYD